MVNFKDVFGKRKEAGKDLLPNVQPNKTTKEKKISPAVPLAGLGGVLIASLGGCWIAVGAAFLLGSWVGYLFSIWLTGRQA